MAYGATFTANLKPLEDALRQAEPKLSAFEQSTKKVQGSLQRMVSEFDGTKVIQQATVMVGAIDKIGGAAKLTEAEQRKVNSALEEALAKYRALGQQAPKEMEALAAATRQVQSPLDKIGLSLGTVKNVAAGLLAGFTVDAAIGGIARFVGKTIEAGSAISDLSQKLGVSTTAVQRWTYAGQLNGNTIEQIGQAVTQMSNRLAGGDASAVTAIQRLGLNFEALRAQAPEQAFEAIATAIARVPNPMEQAALAMDLFGKGGAEILPTVKADIAALGDEAERLGGVMRQETITALDALDDSIGKLSVAGQGLIRTVLEPMVPLLAEVADLSVRAVESTSRLADAHAELIRRGGSQGLLISGLLGNQWTTNLAVLDVVLEKVEKIFGITQKRTKDIELRSPLPPVPTREELQRLREQEQATRQLQAATDAWLGRDVLAKADELLRMYQRLGAPATREGVRQLQTTMAAGVQVLEAQGRGSSALAREYSQVALAVEKTKNLFLTQLPLLERTSQEMEDLAAATLEYVEATRDFTKVFDILQTPTLEGVFKSPPPGASTQWAEDLAGELGQAVVQAFAGGGDLARTVGAVLGNAVGTSVGTAIGKSIGGALGKTVGAFAGPVVGALVGEGLGKIFDKLLKTEGKQVNDLRDQFILAAGGLGALNEQAALAGVSLNELLKADSVKEYNAAITRLQLAFAKLEAQVKATLTQLSRISTEGRLLDAQTMRDLQRFRDRPDVREALGTFLEGEQQRVIGGLGTFLANSRISSASSAQAIEGGLLGAFGSLMETGASPLAAVEQLLPLIDQFGAKTQEVVGYQASGAFQSLLDIVALVKDEIAGPALQAVSGLGQVMVGLQNSGWLTQDVFGGLARQIYDTFHGLEVQGKGGTAAIQGMQQPLQRTWELVKDFGYTVDEDTQKLLDFAESSGVIGDRFRPAADRMLLAIDRLISKFDEFLAQLTNRLPGAARDGAREVEQAFSGIRPAPIRLDVELGDLPDLPGFARGSGGVVDFGPGSLAVLHGREAVLTEAQLSALAATSAQGQPITVIVGDDVLASTVLRGAHRTLRIMGGH